MAEFEAPTFSLGFDFGFDSEPQPTSREDSTFNGAPDSTSNRSFLTIEDDNDDDEELAQEVADSDPECNPEAPQVLKRLRRGVGDPSASHSKLELPEVYGNVDDDIEEFSSQEELRRDEPTSIQRPSMCSSSKFPLQALRALSTQTTSHSNLRKRDQDSNASASTSMGIKTSNFEFPNITISPLRRFQLLDSDSDDLYEDKNVSKSSKFDSFSKKRKPNPEQYTTPREEKKTNPSKNMPQSDDLWKDLSPVKTFHIPTPALDEFCQEYFSSVKETNLSPKANGSVFNTNKECFEPNWNASDPVPPAHRYFFHDDPRIRNLVRNRLSNFSPLGVINERTNIPNASFIDYMGQFGNGEDTNKTPATEKNSTARTSTKGRKNSKKSYTEEASGSWVDPKSGRTSIPMDAGRRRVHADGQSAGHWFTDAEGKRVYVNKSGKELSGQTAYRQYRRESGARFRKSKKKTWLKKK